MIIQTTLHPLCHPRPSTPQPRLPISLDRFAHSSILPQPYLYLYDNSRQQSPQPFQAYYGYLGYHRRSRCLVISIRGPNLPEGCFEEDPFREFRVYRKRQMGNAELGFPIWLPFPPTRFSDAVVVQCCPSTIRMIVSPVSLPYPDSAIISFERDAAWFSRHRLRATLSVSLSQNTTRANHSWSYSLLALDLELDRYRISQPRLFLVSRLLIYSHLQTTHLTVTSLSRRFPSDVWMV